MAKIQQETKVAYSVQFLKSIGCSHTDMARGRGVVTEIQDLGSLKLAVIKWNDPTLPKKVNIKNLAIVGANRRFCKV